MLDAPSSANSVGLQAAKPKATILVVDDEPAIRLVLSEILRRQGYAVISCGTGADAVGLLRQGGARIDLVLLDMHLPDVQEESLAAELKQVQCGVRVLASSGFPMSAAVPLELAHIDGYLKKPFDARVLSETVDALLQASSPPRMP